MTRPMFPARIGAYDTPGDAEGIRLLDNLAYLADGSSGLTIVDIRNPAAPRGLASLNLPGYAFGLAITRSISSSVTSTLALVAAGTGGLQIVDCPVYTSDAADARSSVDLGGRRILIKKKQTQRRLSSIS